uniref:F-box domain-containing protein n=1 Tax=Steinernema glaseri TaxID=37863 RepID=A0A1I7Z7H4_9BILA
MESVPARFIESVLRSFGEVDRQLLQHVSSTWGQLAEVYWRKRGSLKILYDCDDQDAWHLYYTLDGFEHIKRRNLSREVFREMSKSITSFEFTPNHNLSRHWKMIDADDEDEMVQLLMRLDAPEKKLDFWWNVWKVSFVTMVSREMSKSITLFEFTPDHTLSRHWKMIDADDENEMVQLLMRLDAPEKKLDLWWNVLKVSFVTMVSRYPHFLRTFTSLWSETSDIIKLCKKLVSTGKLWEIYRPDAKQIRTNFWVDYFFSERCMSLCSYLTDLTVVLAIIDRWKHMDPRNLAFKKTVTVYKIKYFPQAFVNVGMTPIPMESNSEIVEKFRRRINLKRYDLMSMSLHRIDHPVDRRSSIYVLIGYDDGFDVFMLFR